MQRIGVDCGLYHIVPDEPRFDVVLAQRIFDLAFIHAPVKQELTVDTAPELQSLDEARRVITGHSVLSFGRIAFRIYRNLPLKSGLVIICQDSIDRRLRVAFDAF